MVDHSESRVDTLFAALGDPTRRAFLRRLARSGATISELAAPRPISLQAVSKHLKILEEAGLVHIEKRGRDRHVSLDARPLRHIAEWVAHYQAFWENKLDALAAYVEADASPGTPPAHTPPTPTKSEPSPTLTPSPRSPQRDHSHRRPRRRR